jgi:hypothetical protein
MNIIEIPIGFTEERRLLWCAILDLMQSPKLESGSERTIKYRYLLCCNLHVPKKCKF